MFTNRIFLLIAVLASPAFISCASGTMGGKTPGSPSGATNIVETPGGTSNVVPKFSGNNTMVNSSITDDADGKVAIGTAVRINETGLASFSNDPFAFGEVALSPDDIDTSKSYIGSIGEAGPQMHLRVTRAYCDKRTGSLQSASDQANFFCVPDAVTIDDTHQPSTALNKSFMIVPYSFGMAMEYPGVLEVYSEDFSVHTNFQRCLLEGPGRCANGAHLWVGDVHDYGGIYATASDTLANGNSSVDRSQSFVLIASDTFLHTSHGDMLFALRDPLDSFRFQFGSPGLADSLATYKQFTKARIDSTGKGFFDGGTQTGGADFAESVSVNGGKANYEAGDVLVIDTKSDRQVSLSRVPYSTLVAGIYSTKPGVVATLHNSEDPMLADEVPMAIAGIVPCKVSAENGPIFRGDLLVTSSTPGYAMRATDEAKLPGAILGKALQPLLGGKRTIEVLLTLR